jgi:hypothetical protein
MWPSGQAWVCKTFHGGSIPPMTSAGNFIAVVSGVYFYTPLCFFNQACKTASGI